MGVSALAKIRPRLVFKIVIECFYQNRSAFRTNLICRTVSCGTARMRGHNNREIDICGVKVYSILGSKPCGHSVVLNRGKLNIGGPFPTHGKLDIIRTVSDSYLKTFPELEGKYSVHVCRSADGVAQGGTL